MFFNEKIYYDEKKFCLNDRLFLSSRIFTTEHIKIVKNSVFFLFSIQEFSRLKKSQIPDFLRFPGKVAKLIIL